MVDQIQQFEYRYLIADDDTPCTAAIVNQLTDSGVNLLGFSEFPHGPGKTQVDLITDTGNQLEATAGNLGWQLSEKKSGFLVQGEDTPNAIGEVLALLAEARIHVTAVQAVVAGAGRFGAMLWVKPPDSQAAAVVLRSAASFDSLDEALEESFPASDPPVLTVESAE